MTMDDPQELKETIDRVETRIQKYKDISLQTKNLEYQFRLKDKIKRTEKFLFIISKRYNYLLIKQKKGKSNFLQEFEKKYELLLKRRANTVNQIRRKILDIEDGIDELEEESKIARRRNRDMIRGKIRDLKEIIRTLEAKQYKLTKRQFRTKHPEKYEWKQTSSMPKFNAIRKLKKWKKRANSKKIKK